MAAVFVLFLLFGASIIFWQKRTVQFGLDGTGSLVLNIKGGNNIETVYPWNSEQGILYFILPSFVETNNIYCDGMKDGILSIDGGALRRWSRFQWDKDAVYTISYSGAEYQAAFARSANLSTFFIDTQSGGMEYLDEDKDHEEQGHIRVFSPRGNMEYAKPLPRISERGNSTFFSPKRSYAITLKNEYPLCGMEAGKRWNLLALYGEDDKIHSKLAYDMARFLEMEFSPDSTWIDLYCNGEYKGLFLLTEAVTVGGGRVEIFDLEKENRQYNSGIDMDMLLPVKAADKAYYSINNPPDLSGGYLLEKDLEAELKPGEAFFKTSQCGYVFVVRKPDHASEEEVDYIRGFVQKIEDSIVSGTDEYKKYIDVDSFARQFLIEKIVMDADEMEMSTFYYKDKGAGILKAGPVWDYDRAMGAIYSDYTLSVKDRPGGMGEWYLALYEDEAFYDALVRNFEKLLPYMEELLAYGIDEYADMLCEAVHIDTGIMKQYAMGINRNYREYGNYVRYLKYFLANRLNYLIALWDIPHEPFAAEASNGQMHTVTFLADSDTVLTERQIMDGECLTELPVLHDPEAFGWRYFDTEKFYEVHQPVYEDTVLIERTWDNRSYMEYKVGNLQSENNPESYLEKLNDEDFSCVIYIPDDADSGRREAYLHQLRALSRYGYGGPAAGKTGKYLLVTDSGQQMMWEADLDQTTAEAGTTFGLLRYGLDDTGKAFVCINDSEENYLDSYQGAGPYDILMVAINRAEGSVADVAAFAAGSRLTE